MQSVRVFFLDFLLILQASVPEALEFFIKFGFIEEFLNGSHDCRSMVFIFDFGSVFESEAFVQTDRFRKFNEQMLILLSF